MVAIKVISLFFMVLCAVIIIIIGIIQMKSQEPMPFWSDEKTPEKEELTNVTAYNCFHGVLWIILGVVLVISLFLGYFTGKEYTVRILLGGIFFMMAAHKVIVRCLSSRDNEDRLPTKGYWNT